MVNINHGKNSELLSRCELLAEYTIFVEKVRSYSKNMPLTEAVDRAVDECVEEGVLEYFLNKHRKEVRNMVLTEFDEEKYLKMMRDEERAAGIIEGHASGLKEGLAKGALTNLISILNDLGEVPAQLLERANTLDSEGIKAWTKMASRADSMGEFLEQIAEL